MRQKWLGTETCGRVRLLNARHLPSDSRAFRLCEKDGLGLNNAIQNWETYGQRWPCCLAVKKGSSSAAGSRFAGPPANERCFDTARFDAISCVGRMFGMPQRFTTGRPSGIAAYRPAPKGPVVAAVNGAIESLVYALAVELAPIRVNAVSPGWVDTPVWDSVVSEGKAGALEAMASACRSAGSDSAAF